MSDTTPDGYPQTAAAAATGMANSAADWVDSIKKKAPDFINNLPSTWYGADDGVTALETFRTGEVWRLMVKSLLEFPDIPKVEYFAAFQDVDAFEDAEVYAALYLLASYAYSNTPNESNHHLMTHYQSLFKEALADPRIQIDADTLADVDEDDEYDEVAVSGNSEFAYLR